MNQMRLSYQHIIMQTQDAYAIGLRENREFGLCEIPYLRGVARMAIAPAVSEDTAQFEHVRAAGGSLGEAFAVFD